ncbi:hypothetical protein HN51_048218 [Arachis hypogaea]
MGMLCSIYLYVILGFVLNCNWKVSRDIKLLQSTNLEELVSSCLLVIEGDRSKQKVHLFREFFISMYRWFSEAIKVLKRKKCDNGKYNFIERLLGAARLLAEIS